MYLLNNHFNNKNPFLRKLEDEEALKALYAGSREPKDRQFTNGKRILTRMSMDKV